MNFCWCTITTNFMEESVRFYKEIVGLTVSARFSPRPGMEIVFLKDGNGAQVELIRYDDEMPVSEKTGISIGFEAATLDDALSLVADKGIEVVRGPFITPEVKYFYVKDPNGVLVQFAEQIKK